MEENGITLIALVVTIVVLLILAGVSINLVLSNNGVISKAKDAKEKHLQAQENDTSYLNDVSDWIEQDVSTNGAFSKYKVGDYVDYKPALETETDEGKKTYSLTTDKSGVAGDPQTIPYESGLKWRILKINEDTGKIDIVADPTTAGVKFYGATGYNNGVYALNDICEQLYSNKAKGVTARSINLADLEKNLTPEGFASRNEYNKNSPNWIQYGKTRTYTGDYSYYPNYYKNKIGSGVDIAEDKADTITQPDLINTVDPYKGSSYSSSLTNGYTKASTGNLTVTQTYYLTHTLNYEEAAGSVLISHSDRYWVASRHVELYSTSAGAGFVFYYVNNCNLWNSYLFLSKNTSKLGGSVNTGLRPLVSLDASALTEKIGDTWSANL